jgi:predicted metalloendopeptidase
VIGHWGIAAAIALAPAWASYAAIAFASDKSATAAQRASGFHGVAPEQQFFIFWGQNAGAATRLEAERQRVSTDPHPVPKFRGVGPLSNSPEFQQAFSCKAGADMVRPAEKRRAVW